MAISASAPIGFDASSPHKCDRLAVDAALVRDVAKGAQQWRRDRVKTLGDTRIAAIDRIQELHEVVGADREEIDAREKLVELEEERRHLDHGADLDALGQDVVVPAQMREFRARPCLGLVEFVDDRDHRETSGAARGRTQREQARGSDCASARGGRG